MTNRVLRLSVKGTEGVLSGTLDIPCSKYHAHRALLLASLAPGRSTIHGLSDAGHVRYTIGALRSLGTKIQINADTFVVDGGPYHPAGPEVRVGSSGSTLYFLTGLASLADAPVTVVGQRYLQRRPIGPLLDALSSMGVSLTSHDGCPPISVEPRRPSGGHVTISGTLSQWISGLLLLAPFCTGDTTIDVEEPFNEHSYVDLTISMMSSFGLHVDARRTGRRFRVEGGQEPHAGVVTLPPDVGSAAFGLAATALHPSDVVFRGLRATRASETDHPEGDLLDIISAMGLPMAKDPATGDVRVAHDGIELAPAKVDCRSVPDMLPILSVLGTFARGRTVLDHVAHVRLKESDRVAAMLQMNRMGGRLEATGDRLVCEGVQRLSGADLSSFNDHRVLMALAVAASRAEGETRLTYPHAYRISYPRFLQEMSGVGMALSVDSSDKQHAEAPPPPRRHSLDVARAAQVPIDSYVRRWAVERPDDLAVAEVATAHGSSRSLTWRALDEEADALADRLVDLGVTAGDAVAYQLPNWGLFCSLTLAILRVGAVCCPVMPIFARRELAFVLRRSKARVLFVPEHFRRRDHAAEVEALLSSDDAHDLALAHVVVVGDDHRASESSTGAVSWHRLGVSSVAASRARNRATERRTGSPRAIAQLLFTSGTSGEAKGVLQRVDTLTRAAAMEVRHLGLTADDCIFVPSPLAHQTGFLYGMWLAFFLGCPQVVQPVWDGGRALRAMRRWRTTFVQAATPFLADLVAAANERGEQPGALKVFVATGAAVPRGLAEHAARILGTSVCGAWGTTETCLGALGAPGDEPAKTWGTDGRALEGVRLRIVDERGQILAAGEEGNLEVKSACLFEGYLDRPDLTAEVMTGDGWYKTGDLAVLDDAGYLRIRGRVKDVINRGGEKVPVAEIEQLLHRHPGVRDVAIVAMPDDRLGERACAFVVDGEAGELDFETMQSYLKACGVAKHYWPERLEHLEVLPRNPAGKVQKFLLRDRAKAFSRTVEHPR